jgi:(E)-4-hydroxy-3-methyl-but-2-enyl pyrophosphate reductase
MNKIKIAESSGFCFGVSEAVRKTEEAIQKNEAIGKTIYTFGPLIHNDDVVSELAGKGVRSISSLNEAEPGSIIIIRSHGVPESFYAEAASKQMSLIDATCLFVQKIQKLVKEAHEKGLSIGIVGDPNHPEVIGINGWCGQSAYIIENSSDVHKINEKEIFLVAQTTITQDLWQSVIKTLKDKGINVSVNNTICVSTEKRQRDCENLSKTVDAMIIIGGKSSSNTKKLYEIAAKNCKKTFFIERKEDLPLKDIEKCYKIGVATGASTPERIIKEVIATMSELITEDVNVVVEEEEEEVNQMHEMMAEIEKTLRLPGRNEIINGEIIQVTNREVVVNLGCKKDGILPKDEITLEPGQELMDLFKAGDMIEAKVLKTDDGDGNILLSKKKLEVNEHWDEITNAIDNKTFVNAKVVKEVKGGVIAVYKEVSGFIPMSQLSDRFIEKADEFIGKTLPVRVTRVDQKRNKAVFSHKAYLNEERNKKVAEIWNSLSIGDVVEGTVMRFTDYGAFVDIGGIDGLLHISEISWGKLKHPQEALKIGQKIQTKILSMNEEKGKISLGLKQNTPEL